MDKNQSMKTLFLLRGLPGSGKSTLAGNLAQVVYEADMFFMKGGEYQFDPAKLGAAHQWCQESTRQSMINGISRIAVANTFTREWEMEPYIDMALMHGYRVVSLVVENRHGGESIHDVPASAIAAMRDRFEVKL
jgi:predicted kinase